MLTAKAYKFTDGNFRTFGGMQWGKGVSHRAPAAGDLCSSGWIHVYIHPLLAVLLAPYVSPFNDPVLWECAVAGNHKDGECLHKQGWEIVTTIRTIKPPKVTADQAYKFGLACALKVGSLSKRQLEGDGGWAHLSDSIKRDIAAERAWWAATAITNLELLKMAKKYTTLAK